MPCCDGTPRRSPAGGVAIGEQPIANHSGDDQTVYFEDYRRHSVIVITNKQKPKGNDK
jgi:hypothetical protein